MGVEIAPNLKLGNQTHHDLREWPGHSSRSLRAVPKNPPNPRQAVLSASRRVKQFTR